MSRGDGKKRSAGFQISAVAKFESLPPNNPLCAASYSGRGFSF